MDKKEIHAFIGYLRLYRGHYYSIIMTMENHKVKYAILDSNDKEVTDVLGVNWYDLYDVMATMQVLEHDAMIEDSINDLIDTIIHGGEQND